MELHQYYAVIKRRWLPATAVIGLVSSLAVCNLLFQEPVYEAQGKFRFMGGNNTTSLTGVGSGIGDLSPLIESNNPIATEMGVIQSIPMIQTTIDQLDLRDQEGNPLKPDEFLQNLSLRNDRGTDLLVIVYRDVNPERAQRVVDTLMTVYLDNHLRENRAEVVAARQFLEQQLPRAEASVRHADAALRQFKEANQVVALDEEEAALVTAQEELRHRIAEVQAELADANAQSDEFYNQLQMTPKDAIALTALSQSPGVQEVLTEMQTLESQLAIEQARFHEQHPIITALGTRHANLEALLNERVAATLQGQAPPSDNLQVGELQAELVGDFIRSEVRRRGIADQVNTLANSQSFYQQRISLLPRLEQEERELTRQLEAAQSTYSLLLSKLHEIRVTENQSVGNARTIQPAYVDPKPVSPKLISYIATTVILSILAGVATALALESIDKSVRTAKEARELFGATLLGVIPVYTYSSRRSLNGRSGRAGHPSVIVQDDPTAAASEAYRMLRVNLKFLKSDRTLKTIVVTSAVAGEGKSTTSANLASAIAQAGQSVLLIDADMRCPRQHQIWDIPNDVGLSNTLVEQIEPRTIIQKVAANLSVLTAGVTPPNPAALLDSQQMATLLETCAAAYNFVIIDTPALNAAADVPILGRMSDGILLVTRPGVIDVVNAAIARERLEQSEQTLLGQVINGVVDENEAYRYPAVRNYQTAFNPEASVPAART